MARVDDQSQIKEVVVLSGKGGTGKTTVAGGMAWLCPEAVLCDCDVDAANLELILGADVIEEHEFRESRKARIIPGRCAKCGLCSRYCSFDAITDFRVDPFSCEGCGVCARMCSEGAIEMTVNLSGRWFISRTDKGTLVHARLEPGEENSGKLVSLVRREARLIAGREGKKVIISDGPPGIGCPAISALVNADLALIVTEPTLSAVHDLERILDVCKHFTVAVRVCINRHDVHPANSDLIENRCHREGIPVVSRIPYDEKVVEAAIKGQPVTAMDCRAGDSIRQLLDIVRRDLSVQCLSPEL